MREFSKNTVKSQILGYIKDVPFKHNMLRSDRNTLQLLMRDVYNKIKNIAELNQFKDDLSYAIYGNKDLSLELRVSKRIRFIIQTTKTYDDTPRVSVLAVSSDSTYIDNKKVMNKIHSNICNTYTNE